MRLLKNTHLLRSPLHPQSSRTIVYAPVVGLQAPRIWVFLNSLEK
jgi:hypothetical protein